MGATIEQWMRDAAAAIMQLVRDYELDGRRIGHPAKNGLAPITEIIASHAPNDGSFDTTLVDSNGNFDVRNSVQPSEAAAQPTCNCGADRTGPTAEAHAVNCPAEIKHNDH